MLQNKIFLDCDPGEDDALAILLAFAKGLDVAALICGFGNTAAEKAHKNGAGLLTLADATDTPLFKGAEAPYRPHPLEQKNVSAGDFVGENGLCGVVLPDAPLKLMVGVDRTWDERLERITSHLRAEAPVTYIVTGPCTTLAHVLDKLGADAKACISQIIIMGGALDADGNTGPINPATGKSYAEFNFYCDPHAIARVLKSDLPITLVPWDLTEKIVLKYQELDAWRSDTPQGKFVLNLMRNFLESYGNAYARSFEFNDCITITAFEKQGIFRAEKIGILLEREQTARVIRDPNGRAVQFFDLPPSDILPVRNAILAALGVDTTS